MTPRLKTLAADIEILFPDLVTVLDSWTSDTDRHPKGVRWRIPGKGRKGTRLRVFVRRGPGQGPADPFDPIFEHRAGDTYRRNSDVEDWIDRQVQARMAATTDPATTGRLHAAAHRIAARFPDLLIGIDWGTVQVWARDKAAPGGYRLLADARHGDADSPERLDAWAEQEARRRAEGGGR